jgi:hypothetical protein
LMKDPWRDWPCLSHCSTALQGNSWHSKPGVLIAEVAYGLHHNGRALVNHLEEIDGLLLHGQDGQDVFVQVQPLVVWQDHFITLKCAYIT